MRITLHDYQMDRALRQKDGVNLAYSGIAALLSKIGTGDLDIRFHDFLRLCRDEAYARACLSGIDCVIANVGPHAHYYFYLREKLGLDFRIIRDVREALRSNYLLQEYLCRPYLRATDTVLFASVYAQSFFMATYPHLTDFPSLICYPLMHSFPPPRPARAGTLRDKKQVTLGYIGRLSEDKNFPQLVDLLIRLEHEDPGRYRLRAVGDVHSPSCDPSLLAARIAQATGRADIFEYFPPVDHQRVWEFYDSFDVFLFPSTSNIETFGRVLIEAGYWGVPIIGSEHAAASELLPPSALVPVSYYYNRVFDTHSDFPLGEIDVAVMAQKLHCGVIDHSEHHLAYADHPDLFVRALINVQLARCADRNITIGSPAEQRFIKSVRLLNMPEPHDMRQTDLLIQELLVWFNQLQDRTSAQYRARFDELLSISKHPQRTARYIEKSLKSRGDFTNVGGIDFELCHVAGFHPHFELVAAQER